MEAPQVKRTPLHAQHIALNAKMTPFGGFEMPVQYSGIIEEHMAVREKAGIFDVSHMGEFTIEGPESMTMIQQLVSNDASKLYDGRAMYSVICTESGGIVDDLIVYRRSESAYMLVVNASNIEKDWAWVNRYVIPGVEVKNISNETALIAIQGPASFDIVGSLSGIDLSDLKFYHFIEPSPGEFLGLSNVMLSYTGYTGEKGLEIYCHASDAATIWTALLKHGSSMGLKPAGLGARDTLRLESGFCLYGNDITDETSPYEAGLGWITKLDKGDFVGKQSLSRIKADGPSRKLVGFIMDERGIPRQSHVIVDSENNEIGIVTSGSQSPILNQGIGMGYVPNESQFTAPGSKIGILSRGKTRQATVTKPPFHKS